MVLEALKAFLLWAWCWLLSAIFTFLDLLVDFLFLAIPDVSLTPSFAVGMTEVYKYLTILQTFFPLAEFLILYGLVKTTELSFFVFKLIWRSLPGVG